MARILKEEKYPNGSFKSRETELHGRSGQQVILKEGWYRPEVDLLDPWQATDDAQQLYGQQWYKENYANGQKHGVQEAWYENGQQEYKLNHVNGQFHGVQEYWHENGQQEYKLTYVNGQKHGVQEEWYHNGRQWYKENYANGQKHGIQEEWYRNGQQAYKWNYANGQQHGVQEAWNENGQQKYKKYYLDDGEVSQQVYQSYVERLAPEVQATADFVERGLSTIVAGYLLP